MALLFGVMLLYSGYNLFIKVSGGQVPASATTTVAATICLQLAALATSMLFLGSLVIRGGHSFAWAALAGLCIGGAEIGYLYLFGGIGQSRSMPASIAIPIIVSGTIVVSLLVSYTLLKEEVTLNQWLGCSLIVAGIFFLFANGMIDT
jgi:drug/metabolite transporter (DMT)-like permease